jgi:hypothetical protein
MTVAGRVEDRNGTWILTDSTTGKRYTLSGETLPKRCDGLSVHVVGIIEDNFGLGVLHDDAVLRVQRWRVV